MTSKATPNPLYFKLANVAIAHGVAFLSSLLSFDFEDAVAIDPGIMFRFVVPPSLHWMK